MQGKSCCCLLNLSTISLYCLVFLCVYMSVVYRTFIYTFIFQVRRNNSFIYHLCHTLLNVDKRVFHSNFPFTGFSFSTPNFKCVCVSASGFLLILCMCGVCVFAGIITVQQFTLWLLSVSTKKGTRERSEFELLCYFELMIYCRFGCRCCCCCCWMDFFFGFGFLTNIRESRRM